ncbi:hypothetical protein FOA52_003656 [Chlamydomonas sp. UWO 241]|nr:hypothetical protein FOA52_003656 [Chlamydomonas sp. UWO 241]
MQACSSSATGGRFGLGRCAACSTRPVVCRSGSGTTATTIKLQAVKLTPETFAPFGQVIGATDDMKAFDSEDAQLELSRGTPRFYIMRLPRRGLTFSRITYHQQCTQCLGGLNPPGRWFMAVAAPSGSVAAYPKQSDLTVFEVPHGTFIKMHMGTWHAGPLFHEADNMDFYNLELSDTNQVDHNTHDYMQASSTQFEVLPAT